MSQLFAPSGQSIGTSTSASVLTMNIQGWFPLGWTGWITLLSKGLSRVFSSTTVGKHQLHCKMCDLAPLCLSLATFCLFVWCGSFFFKSLLNLLYYCFCFMFQFFGLEVYGILNPQRSNQYPQIRRWSPEHWTVGEVLCLNLSIIHRLHFPGGSEVKVSASNAGDPGSIPGSGRSPGEGNGNPLQYSYLENPMDGEAW